MGKAALAVLGATAIASAFAIASSTVACGGDDASGNASSGGPSSSGGSNPGESSSGNPGSSGGDGSSGATGPGTMHAGCRIFPNDNPWNQDVSQLPVDTDLMTTVMPGMAQSTGMHPDWGTADDNYGIPITVGNAAAPVPITWNSSYGDDESDKLPCPAGTMGGGDFCYPIPLDAKIEGGTGAPSNRDRHVLFLAKDGAPDKCVLYELFNAQNPSSGGWTAASGAIWKLDSNALRPDHWTSADAAGLPVLAGLVRREEIERGEITHAIRLTMERTRQAFIHPATHAAGDEDATLPPMGLRLRLKASFADGNFTGPAKVITTAMKRFGVILADNGSNWYISGETSNAWAPDMDGLLEQLGNVKGSDFEIVKTGPIVPSPKD